MSEFDTDRGAARCEDASSVDGPATHFDAARASRLAQIAQSRDVRRAMSGGGDEEVACFAAEPGPAAGTDATGLGFGEPVFDPIIQSEMREGSTVADASVEPDQRPLTPEQNAFLAEQGIDVSGLDAETLARLLRLLSAAQAAHAMAAGGEADGSALADVDVTIDRHEGPAGLELQVVVIGADASMAFSRTVDLVGGTVRQTLHYQDATGHLLHAQSEHQPRWQALDRMAVQIPREASPAATRGVPGPGGPDELDDFSDLVGPSADGSSHEGAGAFVEGMILGDFGGSDSYSAIAGQTVIGFIPIAGQIADIRDLSAALARVGRGEDGAILGVGIAIAGFVPGLDFLKGGSRLGRRALRDAAEESIDDIARSGMKHAGRRLSRSSARQAQRLLRQLATARLELIERLGRLADDGIIQPATLSRVRSASSLSDYLTPADLSGALRDGLGVPVRASGRGAAWDHLGEVENALASLRLARRSLLRELRHLDPSDDVHRRLSREADSLHEMVRVTRTFLSIR